MLNTGILKNTQLRSSLKGQSTLKPQGFHAKKSLMFPLMLTSLIDAFSILVIYLLVNFSSPTASLNVAGQMELPSVAHSTDLGLGTVISVNKGEYFINDKHVSAADLTRVLVNIHRNIERSADKTGESLVIQADRRADYAALSPIIQAGSSAGFHELKFAVTQGGDKQ